MIRAAMQSLQRVGAGLVRAGAIANAARASTGKLARPAVRTGPEVDFLPAAVEILERPPSPAGRAVAWVIIFFMTSAIIWAIVGTVDVVAVAPGRTLPTGHSKVVQASEAGTITRILVSNGQSVRMGEVLLSADRTFSAADRDRLQGELAATQAELARLNATLSGHPVLAFHPGQAPSPVHIASQRALLSGMLEEQRLRLAAIDAEIARRSADRGSVAASLERLDQVEPLLLERARMQADLGERGFGTRSQALDLEQKLIEHRQEKAVQSSRLAEAGAAMRSLQEQRAQAVASFRRDMMTQRVEAERRLAALREELRKAETRDARNDITAPVGGVVQQLAVHTSGAVVTAGQPLLVIVPDSDTLEVEARVANKDIGFVRSGQSVRVKLDAFLFTRYGTLPGRVLSLSKDAVEGPGSEPVYMARIQLDQDTIDVDGVITPLSPGMSATAEILTDKRRIIAYLLSPIQRAVHDAMRER